LITLTFYLFMNTSKKSILLNRRSPKHRRSQRGNAILFTLLALVIGGIVISVGITQYQDAERAVQVQSTIAEVNTIIGTAKQNYAQYGYAGLTTAIAVGSRVIPVELHDGPAAATATNKFTGPIVMATNAPNTATLTYNAVPSALCTAIVNGTQGIVDTIVIGGTNVKGAGAPVNIGALNTACGGAAAPVIIAWTFGRT
jgi:hypothetical protein